VSRSIVVSNDAQIGRWLQLQLESAHSDYHFQLETADSLDQLIAGPGLGATDSLFAVLSFLGAMREPSLQWLERMLSIPFLPPIAVVADDGDELLAVRCLHQGVADYLPRLSITPIQLQASLARVSANHRRPAPSISASPSGPSQSLMQRDLIPRYRLLDKLGESARATVYLAHSTALDRHVALKVGTMADSGETQFTREYEAIGGMRHPNVVDVYDYGMHDGREFIAMEYFACGDLKARMQNPVTADEAVEYLQYISAALAVVHQQGMVHRDLKPPNIMLRDDGQIVLIDFGLAKSIENATRSTAAGVLRGSPYYMSPEQAQGDVLDGRSDIYSLGIIFYEMLTGTKPYHGATAMDVLQHHVYSPLPQLPQELARYQPLLDSMLAKAREDRFATAQDILTDIDQLAA
jgi:eukaryotic-like serine/threonine-protein kinase